jgi:hypothetical protein
MINTSSNLVMNHSTFLTLEKKESCVFLLCGRKPSKEKNEKKGLETKHGQKQKKILFVRRFF